MIKVPAGVLTIIACMVASVVATLINSIPLTGIWNLLVSDITGQTLSIKTTFSVLIILLGLRIHFMDTYPKTEIQVGIRVVVRAFLKLLLAQAVSLYILWGIVVAVT